MDRCVFFLKNFDKFSLQFKNKVLSLELIITNYHKQACET